LCSPKVPADPDRYRGTWPVDEDRRLTDALERSPKPLAANALLLAPRAIRRSLDGIGCSMRTRSQHAALAIDCVHGSGRGSAGD
jgi:hypothetical protein